jgi:hypothetical protein
VDNQRSPPRSWRPGKTCGPRAKSRPTRPPQEPNGEEPDEQEEPAEQEDETEEEADDEEETDDETDEEEDEPVVAQVDLEVQAFLAKYGNDTDKALKGAAELYRIVGKQANERDQAGRARRGLEQEMQAARAFTPMGDYSYMNDEQRQWVCERRWSQATPPASLGGAMQEGAFDMARAVVREWARGDFSALRAGGTSTRPSEIANYVEPIDLGRLLDALKAEIPDLPNYSAQMAQVLQTLGDNHPDVLDARSDDLGTAARGIVRIYEFARASSASVRSARQDVRDQQRQNGAVAKRKAVVSSSSASPPSSETPRAVRIGPGLTLEQLEAEFARR